jgi:hypothetical protein
LDAILHDCLCGQRDRAEHIPCCIIADTTVTKDWVVAVGDAFDSVAILHTEAACEPGLVVVQQATCLLANCVLHFESSIDTSSLGKESLSDVLGDMARIDVLCKFGKSCTGHVHPGHLLRRAAAVAQL